APDIRQMILMFRSSYAFMYFITYLVAAVGILNTARMSALERRREFGVMLAIGMRPRRMFRTLAAETAVLGLLGAGLGALAGTLLSAYHASAGLDLTLFTDQAAFSFMGVAFSERLHFILRVRHVVEPVVVMLGVALLSGLWPAVKAARIDPAPTIAGRT
ncbi:MAG: FtsX-like permease family protein, partial [Gemmatimonadota bacterium]